MEGPICYIVGAGTFYEEGFAPERGDFVIAADGGYQILLERGVTMDLVVGDFDSIGFRPDHPNVVDLPVEKDDTDMMAAIRLGRERGFRSFCLYGGTGGRGDHTLANLQSLLYLRRRGARGYMYDDDFLWTVMENESLTIQRTVEWGLFSAFSLGDRAEGIDETGFQYPLENAVLTAEFPLGVSNHILEPEATIRVRRGALAVGWQLAPLSER